MRSASALLALALAACATAPSADAPLPPFPTYPREQSGGGDRIYIAAGSHGQLTLRGRCLGLVRNRTFSMIVWPYTARLGRDRRGLFVTDSESGVTMRLGDWIAFGGGSEPGGGYGFGEPLSEPVPPECRARVATLHPGIEKHRRR
jgi:hypothetical protein